MDQQFTKLCCVNCGKLIGYVNLQLLGIDPSEINYICRIVYDKKEVVVNCFCSEECAKVYGLGKLDD